MLRTLLRYAFPMALLGGITLGFLLMRHYKPLPAVMRYVVIGVATLPLLGSGTLHLFAPSVFLPLLPAWVPQRSLIVIATGVFELAGAAGLFVPPTRAAAGTWLAVMMVAVFPANIFVAGQWIGGLQMPGIPVRTAMQAAYIVLLLVAGLGRPMMGKPAATNRK